MNTKNTYISERVQYGVLPNGFFHVGSSLVTDSMEEKNNWHMDNITSDANCRYWNCLAFQINILIFITKKLTWQHLVLLRAHRKVNTWRKFQVFSNISFVIMINIDLVKVFTESCSDFTRLLGSFFSCLEELLKEKISK